MKIMHYVKSTRSYHVILYVPPVMARYTSTIMCSHSMSFALHHSSFSIALIGILFILLIIHHSYVIFTLHASLLFHHPPTIFFSLTRLPYSPMDLLGEKEIRIGARDPLRRVLKARRAPRLVMTCGDIEYIYIYVNICKYSMYALSLSLSVGLGSLPSHGDALWT